MLVKCILLVLFFAVMIGVGIYCRRTTTDVVGFVLGGRNVGSWLTAFAFGTSYFSAVIFVSTPEQFDVLLHRTRLGSTKQGNRELMQTIDVGDMLTVRVEEVDREAEKIVISLVSVKEKHLKE